MSFPCVALLVVPFTTTAQEEVYFLLDLRLCNSSACMPVLLSFVQVHHSSLMSLLCCLLSCVTAAAAVRWPPSS
jgi:hypothetical protein